jgi:hypothetical protein
MKKDVIKRSIFWDIVWTVLTFGLFNIYVQIRQIMDSNDILGREEFSFWKLLVLSILTLGLYFMYFEYKMTKELQLAVNGSYSKEVCWLCAIATFFGLWFVVDSYQQSLINLYSTKTQVLTQG